MDKERIWALLERRIRATSGWKSLSHEIGIGHDELNKDEAEIITGADLANKALRKEFLNVSQDELIDVIFALTEYFGDTSTEEGEQRLGNVKNYFLDEE